MKTYRAVCHVKNRNSFKIDTVEICAPNRDDARRLLCQHYVIGEWELLDIEYLNEVPAYHPELIDDHCEIPNCS